MAKYDESYTIFFEQLKRTNGSVVKVSCSESGDMGSSPEELCRAQAILHGTEPVSALRRALFIFLCSL